MRTIFVRFLYFYVVYGSYIALEIQIFLPPQTEIADRFWDKKPKCSQISPEKLHAFPYLSHIVFQIPSNSSGPTKNTSLHP